ncbi:MAG: heme exporter protein CcmB [Legionellaceae bacterium]|nr:heme exporter protein CcmB [Legionellaceae bacterium]
MISLVTLFKRQVAREMLMHVRELRLCINSCLFFLMIVVFFPLTMPPDVVLFRMIAPGLVWIAMLFALFLSAERLFQQDYDDGVIEQWLVSGYPLSVMILAKMVVHWLLNLLPMLIFCPILALLLGLNYHETIVLMLSLICGTPTILAFCAMAAAFSTGLKQKGVLMALILLPLTIPVMILGSAAITAAMHDISVTGYLALLLAMSCIAVTFLPFAIAGIVRISLVD